MPTDKDSSGPPNQLVPWERNFRENMVRLREQAGMTQTQLARRLADVWHLSFHQQTIQRIESGLRPVRLNEAILIARELGADIEFMMSAATPDSRKMVYTVERVRRKARMIADEVMEMLDDWSDDVTPLVLEVDDHLKRYDGKNPSPALKYGFAWAKNFWEAHIHLLNGVHRLLDIAEGKEAHERYTYQEFDHMDDWWDIYDELFTKDEFPKPPTQENTTDATET